jgi:hypothetical protein
MINIIKKHHRKVILTVPILFLMISTDSTMLVNSVFLKSTTIFPEIGTSFTIDLNFSSNKPFNATEGIIEFPAKYLSIQKLDTANTAIDLWGVPPEWSNSIGIATWSGGIISPQYIDGKQKGSILKIWAIPNQSAPFNITIKEAALLEANGTAHNLIENIGSIRIYPRPKNTPSPDIDGDRKLTTKDITQVILGMSKTYNSKLDINNDRIVNYKDANQMIAYYNEINK